MRRFRPGRGKGQISIDYLIAIIILGVLSLILFQAYAEGDKQAMSSIEKEHMRSVAERLAGAIDSAVIMGDGAKKVVTLPNSTISGRQYNITLKGNALLLKWKGSDYATRFSTSDLNMTAIDPYTLNLTNITLNPGNILVTNSNGTIKLQNVEDNFI